MNLERQQANTAESKEMPGGHEKRVSVERVRNLETYGQERINFAEKGLLDLQKNGAEEMERIGQELDVNAQSLGACREKLSSISERAQTLFEKMKVSVQRAVVGASMLAATSPAFAENNLQKGVGDAMKDAQRIEKKQNEPNQSSAVTNDENGADTLAEAIRNAYADLAQEAAQMAQEKPRTDVIENLKDSLMTDAHERLVIVYGKNGTYETVEIGTQGNFAKFSLNQIEDQLKKGAQSVEILHTHNLENYPYYSIVEKRNIREGTQLANPMPPSATDISALVKEMNYFGKDAAKIKNKIIDPTGEWDISLDLEHPFVRGMVRLYNKLDALEASDPIAAAASLGLSAEQVGILQKHAEKLQGMHPEQGAAYLLTNSETREIGVKMKSWTDDMAKESVTADGYARFSVLFDSTSDQSLAMKLQKYDGENGTMGREHMLRTLIKEAKEFGVQLTYRHNENFNHKTAESMTETVRNEVIGHIGSSEYLQRLTKEFDGDAQKARGEQEKRMDRVRKVDVVETTFEEVWEKSDGEFKKTDPQEKILGGFYRDGRRPVIYVNHHDPVSTRHELLHAATRANAEITEAAKKVLDDSYKKQGLLGLFEDARDAYYREPTERLVRKQALDKELADLGIKAYGEALTDEHQEKMMQLYQEKALSYESMDFIKRTKKGAMKQIFDEIAKEEREQDRFSV